MILNIIGVKYNSIVLVLQLFKNILRKLFRTHYFTCIPSSRIEKKRYQQDD